MSNEHIARDGEFPDDPIPAWTRGGLPDDMLAGIREAGQRFYEKADFATSTRATEDDEREALNRGLDYLQQIGAAVLNLGQRYLAGRLAGKEQSKPVLKTELSAALLEALGSPDPKHAFANSLQGILSRLAG